MREKWSKIMSKLPYTPYFWLSHPPGTEPPSGVAGGDGLVPGILASGNVPDEDAGAEAAREAAADGVVCVLVGIPLGARLAGQDPGGDRLSRRCLKWDSPNLDTTQPKVSQSARHHRTA